MDSGWGSSSYGQCVCPKGCTRGWDGKCSICATGKPWKRSQADILRKRQLCPKGLTACPITGVLPGIAVQQEAPTSFECLDTQEELTSVGNS